MATDGEARFSENLAPMDQLSNTPPSQSVRRLSAFIHDRGCPSKATDACLIGVLRGEGIGPEVIESALAVLGAIEASGKHRFELRRGGPIGHESELVCGEALSEEVTDFCRRLFADRGVLLAGPGGGRFVYDMRRRFDLFCKFNPLVPSAELGDIRRFAKDDAENIDILVVRDNSSGVYQGEWSEEVDPQRGRVARHKFAYSEVDVRRLIDVAARAAQTRRGKLTVIVKPAGVPSISQLWTDCAREIAREHSVSLDVLEVDYAAYAMVQHADQFDVIVTPNLFGDIIADLGGLLLGSRGLCYSASFSQSGAAVYQTNHGAAHDLAGTDRANPVGQILSLAMMLRESFALETEAERIESAVADVWRSGWRTEDVASEDTHVIGTREMTDRIVQRVVELGEHP